MAPGSVVGAGTMSEPGSPTGAAGGGSGGYSSTHGGIPSPSSHAMQQSLSGGAPAPSSSSGPPRSSYSSGANTPATMVAGGSRRTYPHSARTSRATTPTDGGGFAGGPTSPPPPLHAIPTGLAAAAAHQQQQSRRSLGDIHDDAMNGGGRASARRDDHDSGAAGGGGGGGEMSALAAAASDQLHELERREALRRAEFDMRHRQMARNSGTRGSGSGSNPGSGSNTPERFGLSNASIAAAGRRSGTSTPTGLAAAAAGVVSQSSTNASAHRGQGPAGNAFYPVSAAQPASDLHPAVPPGTLADPTYLLPPTCHHEACHKSYRKRLKLARQTQACPHCLTLSIPPTAAANSGGSSSSTTPQSRSLAGSHEDLHGLGQGAAAAMAASQQQQQAIQQHLQRLAANQAQQRHNQQKLLAQMKSQANAHAFAAVSVATSGPSPSGTPSAAFRRSVGSESNTQGGLRPPGPGGFPPGHRSNPPSRHVSPASESSDDFDDHPHVPSRPPFDVTPLTSPVLGSMKSMSLSRQQHDRDREAAYLAHQHHLAHGHHHGRPERHAHFSGSVTAPGSILGTPIHSRGPSRAGSPDHDHLRSEGHLAGSGKHGGHTSHYARDAKNRAHPYGSSHGLPTGIAGVAGGMLANTHSKSSSNIAASNAGGGRMSPPRFHRTLSGNHLVGLNDTASSSSSSSGTIRHGPATTTGPRQDWRTSLTASMGRKSVEEILNQSARGSGAGRLGHSGRILPPPSSSGYGPSHAQQATTAAAFLTSRSAPTSAHTSPANSRPGSPDREHANGAGGGGDPSNMSALSRSVRAAFGMTPIHRGGGGDRFMSESSGPISPPRQARYVPGLVSPPTRLPPLGDGSGQGNTGSLPSLSRQSSPSAATTMTTNKASNNNKREMPSTGRGGNGDEATMEVDERA